MEKALSGCDAAHISIESDREDECVGHGRVLHPEIKKFRRIPYFLPRLIASNGRNAELKAGLDIVSYLERMGERGDPTEANAILGAPQLTLKQWLRTGNAARARA